MLKEKIYRRKQIVEETKKRRRIHRWLLLLVIILAVIFTSYYPPIQPHVQLPAEPLTPPLFKFAGQDFAITNTFVATLIADAILILIALGIRRQIKKGKTVVEGLAGIFSMVIEAVWGITESTAGKWAKKIFPIVATIMILLIVVNLMELIPGVDSIGLLHHSDHGYPIEQIVPGVYTIVQPEEGAHGDEHAANGEHAEDEHAEEGEHGGEPQYGLYPFVRVASTDLSFTVALALIAVVMIQVIGFQALGLSYLKKYLDLSGVVEAWKQPGCSGPLGMIMGLVTSVVGPLEIVAEISKIISFAFRLFGNIFAGAIVLFVIGSLVPWGLQSVFLLLEFGVGLIQAFVFGMLTLVFMSMATHAHGEDHH
jgi:F-type H+-transporting ATPase subunit a